MSVAETSLDLPEKIKLATAAQAAKAILTTVIQNNPTIIHCNTGVSP
jgi:hypothetical protein